MESRRHYLTPMAIFSSVLMLLLLGACSDKRGVASTASQEEVESGAFLNEEDLPYGGSSDTDPIGGDPSDYEPSSGLSCEELTALRSSCGSALSQNQAIYDEQSQDMAAALDTYNSYAAAMANYDTSESKFYEYYYKANYYLAVYNAFAYHQEKLNEDINGAAAITAPTDGSSDFNDKKAQYDAQKASADAAAAAGASYHEVALNYYYAEDYDNYWSNAGTGFYQNALYYQHAREYLNYYYQAHGREKKYGFNGYLDLINTAMADKGCD